jgi:putative peptide zinc metalloprotease protein
VKRSTLLFLAVFAALLAAWAWPGAAVAQDNSAVAVNTEDGTSIFELAFDIHEVTGEVVDSTNAAVAYASCEDCQSIAIAFQIVLVFSDPEVVTPENVAVAVNYECTSCISFASAFQWVIGTGGPVEFTREGKKRLKALKRQLKALRRRDLTLEELIAELEEIRAEIADILATELVPAKPKKHDDDDDDDDDDDGGGGGGPPTPTTTTTPTEPATTTEPTTSTEEVTTTTSG